MAMKYLRRRCHIPQKRHNNEFCESVKCSLKELINTAVRNGEFLSAEIGPTYGSVVETIGSVVRTLIL